MGWDSLGWAGFAGSVDCLGVWSECDLGTESKCLCQWHRQCAHDIALVTRLGIGIAGTPCRCILTGNVGLVRVSFGMVEAQAPIDVLARRL